MRERQSVRRAVAVISTIILPPLAQLALSFSSLIGYLYTRSWPTRNVPYFDHRYDHLYGPGNWQWTERGVFGASAIPSGGKALDVCCGEGMYAGLFYSSRGRQIDGIDRDSRAIRAARRHYRKPNVRFFCQDVLDEPFPDPPYDAIFLFASIEHFTPDDGSRLLQKIRDSLVPGGVFLGSTPIFTEVGGHNEEHANEFLSEGSLRAFLTPHFPNVRLWTSRWPTRVEAYFQAPSDMQATSDVAIAAQKREGASSLSSPPQA